MNIFVLFLQEIKDITISLQKKNFFTNNSEIAHLINKIVAEPPKNLSHGDIATNVAMVLAKAVGMKPMDIAHQYVEELGKNPAISKLDIAGPGFVNITLSADFWLQQLKNILSNHQTYGHSSSGKGKNINVEYVSTNPTGPLHIGHCRVAIVGDVMANLLAKSGYKVTKEYYINDAGGQADSLARSVYKRYLESLGHDVSEIGEYTGDYLIVVGQKLAKKVQDRYVNLPEHDWLADIKEFAITEMMAMIKSDLAKLNIHHDVFTSELAIVKAGKVDQAIDDLQQKGLVYNGVLEKPKGFSDEDWEPRKQLLFKSSEFGDDTDRAIKKSDNSWTYFASDIAYHLDKMQRDNTILLNIWGADHIGFVKRLTAAVNALSDKSVSLHFILCKMVRFIENGQALKMSKRLGNFITVDDAISRVGVDAMRFMMVSRKNDAALDFDFAKVLEQTKDNPVFYVQYAYARCHSIRRNILDLFPDINIDYSALADLSYGNDYADEMIEIIKKLVEWPRVLESATSMYEPHRVTYYLSELAGCFHSMWNKGSDNLSLRFIDESSKSKTQKNFAFVLAVITVLRSGLEVLGVTPTEEM